MGFEWSLNSGLFCGMDVCMLRCFGSVLLFATLGSPSGSSVHGDSPGKKSGLPYPPPPRDLPDPGIKPKSHVSCVGRWILYH